MRLLKRVSPQDVYCATLENAPNQIRYLGFNTTRPVLESKAFRQAVATLVDKEFLTNVVLQGAAFPMYSVVPEGNQFWLNPDVPQIGRELTREQRILEAVSLLRGAGFSWDKTPRWNADSRGVDAGEGLKVNGELVPELELMSVTEGYDHMRATAAIWIERWLNEAGIPVKANLTGIGEIVGRAIFSGELDFDMYILGLDDLGGSYPGYLVDFFHSEGQFPIVGYSNPDYDSLADEFQAESDLNVAKEKAFELQAILAEELPLMTLFNVPILEAYREDVVQWAFTEVLNGVQGYFQNMNGPLSYIRID